MADHKVSEADMVMIQKVFRRELIKFMADQPDYGSVGIVIHFHQGRIDRIGKSSDEAMKFRE